MHPLVQLWSWYEHIIAVTVEIQGHKNTEPLKGLIVQTLMEGNLMLMNGTYCAIPHLAFITW